MFLDRYKIYRTTEKVLNINVLLRILMKIEGMRGVTLINVEGIPISSILPQGADETRLATMTTAIISLGERVCKVTKLGDLNILFIQGEEGTLLVVSCGSEYILNIALDNTINNEQLFTQYFKIIDLIRSTIGNK